MGVSDLQQPGSAFRMGAFSSVLHRILFWIILILAYTLIPLRSRTQWKNLSTPPTTGFFLQVLREAREKADLTQVQLAQKIGETQTFVSKCERGERRVDVVELRTFCQAIGLNLKQFVAMLDRALAKVR